MHQPRFSTQLQVDRAPYLKTACGFEGRFLSLSLSLSLSLQDAAREQDFNYVSICYAKIKSFMIAIHSSESEKGWLRFTGVGKGSQGLPGVD